MNPLLAVFMSLSFSNPSYVAQHPGYDWQGGPRYVQNFSSVRGFDIKQSKKGSILYTHRCTYFPEHGHRITCVQWKGILE